MIETLPQSGSTGPPGSQQTYISGAPAGAFESNIPVSGGPPVRGRVTGTAPGLPPYADAAALDSFPPAGTVESYSVPPGSTGFGSAGSGLSTPAVNANLPGGGAAGMNVGARDMPGVGGFGGPSSGAAKPSFGGSVGAPGAAAIGAGAAGVGAIGAGAIAAANIPSAGAGDSRFGASGPSAPGASPGSAALSPSGPVSASANIVSSGTSGGLGGPGSPHLAAAPMSLEAGALRNEAPSGISQGSMAGVDAGAFGSIEGPPTGMQSSGEAGITDAPSFRVIGTGPEAAGVAAAADVGPAAGSGNIPDLSPDVSPEAPAKRLGDFGGAGGGAASSSAAAAGLAAGAGLGVAAVAAGATASGREGASSAVATTGGTMGTRGGSELVTGQPGVSLDSAAFGASSATAASGSTSATVPTSHLTRALDAASRSPRPFLDRYKLYDNKHREFTDTAVIQRASGKSDGLDYAIKFFTSRAAYERERSMYADRDLRAALPPVTEIRSNEDGEVTAEGGFVFPPFIVTDRGESLDTWARNKRDPGFAATVRVLRDVAGQVKGLHAQGLVHRNLNPESILWRPKHQCWSLDDFGCADVAGAPLATCTSVSKTPFCCSVVLLLDW